MGGFQLRILSPLLILVALTVSATAEECTPSTSDPEVTTCQVGFACWYVDNDVCQPECVFSIWLYEESNGIEGLQRGDEVHDDTCGGRIDSDTIPS